MPVPSIRRLTAIGISLLLLACGDGRVGGDGKPAAGMAVESTARRASVEEDGREILIQQLYLTFLGRPADPDGLRYFKDRLQAGNLPATLSGLSAAYSSDKSARALLSMFADSAESKALYNGNTPALIAAVYRQTFNRDAEALGLQFWLMSISNGGNDQASAVLNIVSSAQGSDLETFQNKLRAARNFTTAVDTPERRKLYDDMGSNALVRDMIGLVHSQSKDAEMTGDAEDAIATLSKQGGYVVQDGYVEVPASERNILLLVAANQLALQRDRLDRLATVLASDLNRRSGQFGPNWKVQVAQAANTIDAVRAQLTGKAGAILIGAVMVPSYGDLGDGNTVPMLDAYRVPNCTRYKFPIGTIVTEPTPGSDQYWLDTEDPACRNGMTVSLLRGRSMVTEYIDLAVKLDQMISYHSAAGKQDAEWLPKYEHVSAISAYGNDAIPQSELYWNDIPLYTAQQVSYFNQGTATDRLAKFLGCAGSMAEMCSVNLHGTSGAVSFQGQDQTTGTYSNDSVWLSALDVQSKVINAKFIDLQSCSTQDFFQANSMGTSLLMSGRTMLTLGSTAVSIVSNWYEKTAVEEHYQSLSFGATFAEAFAGKMDNTPLNFQGDPFITLRPKPQGALPKLVVNGKHYNSHPAIVRMSFGDSEKLGMVRKSITLSNRGSADLNLRMSIFVDDVTSTLKVNPPEGASWSGQGFSRESPDVVTRSGFGKVGDKIHVVKPGASIELVLAFQPTTNLGNKVTALGRYTGKYEFYSNDPDSPRIILELKGNAR
jgi:hypothetical protein